MKTIVNRSTRAIIVILLVLIASKIVLEKIALVFNPSPPIIKHGEFPFHLNYEMNGKVYDINDSVVCDFDRIGSNSGFGEIRWWNEHLKSGTERITILRKENVRSIIKPNRIDSKIEVYYNYGDANFFMGDPTGASSEKPQIEYIETYEESPKEIVIEATELTPKQLQKYFDIRIIDWTHSQPIKNTFK